ncbi:MAG: response regulator transcription factor [Alphaproteobacteria bacterium]|nr:response regulator transcription factor [Alphaproteobacteria bacterium]
MSEKIVLVDDDRNITTSVSMALESEGFIVKTFNDGEAGLQGIQEEKPNLAVLDVKMPRMDGLELLENIRKTNQTLPIIFLTSKDDEVDQVLGLRMGADDYITKPFSQRLLIERIRTLLRRQKLQNEAQNEEKTIRLGDMILDDDRYLCAWKGEPVPLTVTEYLLLKTLTANPGHVKSRDQLIEAAYGETIYVDDRTIDSHIKRVRQKFKKTDPDFDRIEAVYGAGYRFSEE